MQLCLGATYSWSVYVMSIRKLLGISQATVQLPFSVFYFVFPFTMIFSGFLLDKIGPRKSSILGGLLFGGGWILSSLGYSSFLFTVLGNGLVAGLGAGIAYIVPISTCIKWFPKHKGFVTGFAVAGFGGGAALVSQVAGLLLKTYSPFYVFFVLGLSFLIVIFLSGINMINPPGYGLLKEKKVRFSLEVVKEKNFLILYFAMFAGLSAGFAVNANLKELFHASNLKVGVWAVSFFAITNALGRIIWGFIFDRTKSFLSISLNLFFQAALLLLSPFILVSDEGLLFFAAVSGFNYGGVLVLYAGTVARVWGSEKIGSIYGLLFSSNIPAALAPIFAGYVYDKMGSFTLSLVLISILMITSMILVLKERYSLNRR